MSKFCLVNTEAMKIISGLRLVQACVTWPAIFVTTTFIMFYSFNSRFAFAEDRKVPTISETGFISPESIVLTYGLHSEAFMLCFLFLSIFTVYDQKINDHIHLSTWNNEEKADLDAVSTLTGCLYCCCNCFCITNGAKKQYNTNLLHLWNRVCLVLGFVCCFCMSMVGSVTLAVNVYVHSFFAFVMFFTGVLHMLLFYTKIAWYLEDRRHRLLVYQALLTVCIPFNLLIAVVAGSLYMSCSSHSCQAFAVNISPVAEFWTTAALLAYCYSFRADIECVTLKNLLNKAMLASSAQESKGGASGFDSVANNNPALMNQILINSARNSVDVSVSAIGNHSLTSQC